MPEFLGGSMCERWILDGADWVCGGYVPYPLLPEITQAQAAELGVAVLSLWTVVWGMRYLIRLVAGR